MCIKLKERRQANSLEIITCSEYWDFKHDQTYKLRDLHFEKMFGKQLLYVRPPYSAYHKKRPGFSALINKMVD